MSDKKVEELLGYILEVLTDIKLSIQRLEGIEESKPQLRVTDEGCLVVKLWQ